MFLTPQGFRCKVGVSPGVPVSGFGWPVLAQMWPVLAQMGLLVVMGLGVRC